VSGATALLERPIWHALTTHQRSLAVGGGGARRFPADVSPFAAAADDDPAALSDLADLVSGEAVIVLLQAGEIPTPPGLLDVVRGDGVQMVATAMAAGAPVPAEGPPVVALTDDDAVDMVALAAATRPGPFEARTNTLGDFVGIREGGRLVAMAGERLALGGHVEVSGVCTDPSARGRGYAALLSSVVAQRILARGSTPFLHAYAGNTAAIRVYERLGFHISRPMSIAAFRRA
jgi:predicted GNAT family acetyltransferase